MARAATLESYASIPFSVDYARFKSDSCLLIVRFQNCQWSDGLDVLVLSVPFLGVSLPPFFFFLGKLEGAMLFSPFHE